VTRRGGKLNTLDPIVLRRKRFIFEALGRCMRPPEVVDAFKSEFKLGTAQAYRYLQACYDDMKTEALKDRESAIAESVNTCNIIIRQAMNENEKLSAIKAIMHRDTVRGLVKTGSAVTVNVPGAGKVSELSTKRLMELAAEMGIDFNDPDKPKPKDG